MVWLVLRSHLNASYSSLAADLAYICIRLSQSIVANCSCLLPVKTDCYVYTWQGSLKHMCTAVHAYIVARPVGSMQCNFSNISSQHVAAGSLSASMCLWRQHCHQRVRSQLPMICAVCFLSWSGWRETGCTRGCPL